MKIRLRNKWGQYVITKHGFSWTTFFFGFFTPLVRGDWKWVGIMLVIDALTLGFGTWVIAFFYNRKYIEDRLAEGFKPADEFSQEQLQMNGYMFDPVDFKEEKETEKREG